MRRDNTRSCGFCNENSHGNLKIQELLQKANIPFVREKRFEDCRDKAQLPFDFYVNNTYLIEYDGRQHFQTAKENSLFYSETIKIHDEIKNSWARNHNIPLIRIPYTHFDNLSLDDLKLETSKFLIN